MFDDIIDSTPVEQTIEAAPQEAVEAKTQPTEEERWQARNFKELRQNAEQIKRERDEALRLLQEMRTAMNTQSAPEQDYEDNIGIGDTDLAEGKHLKSVSREIKQLKKQLEAYSQRSSEMSVEARLKAEFPDFDKVVTKDSIDTLRMMDSALASSIHKNPDLYEKAVAAYNSIKRYNIVQEDTFGTDRAVAKTNAAKPKPLASMSPQQGDSPLSHANAFANGLTDDLKKQLFKEMMDARKGII